MIVEFSTEFERIATAQGAEYVSKKVSELEDFVQGYGFANGLVNFVPINDFDSEIGASSQMIYKGNCVLQFLTKAVKSDNFEATKDILIDEMILLSEGFFRGLNLNENLIFNNPTWQTRTTILRQYTANFIVGVESRITFETACNRL